MSSKRLPGKYCSHSSSTIIKLFTRLSNSQTCNILVGTSNSKSDDILVSLLSKKVSITTEILEDVMARFASICNHYKPDYVVKLQEIAL